MRTVYTIGYEGAEIERFAGTLIEAGVELLADVRAVALSRKKGFSKSALAIRCAQGGLDYRHLVELGDPKEGREAARAGRYADFRIIYAAHLASVPAALAVESLAALAAEQVTCMMCFERDPLTCHRSLVGERLRDRGFSIFHLAADMPAQALRHAANLSRRHPGQGATAA